MHNNILNLPDLDMEEFDDDYRFLVETTASPPSLIFSLYPNNNSLQLRVDSKARFVPNTEILHPFKRLLSICRCPRQISAPD